MTVVGVCEDDNALRSLLVRGLRQAGHDVVPTATAAEALRAFAGQQPDVIVLDIGLPDADGRDVCAALRANGVSAPVLLLTALDGLHHKVSGFEAGADDYLTKPFEFAELLVRLMALTRRSATGRSDDAADVVLDPLAHAIVHGERRVRLSPTEFRLLARLVGNPGDVVRRGALIAAAWPDGALVSDNTLDSYVRRIRTKLAASGVDPGRLETARGVGYAWR
jgi:two-component system OmpR family response regulator